MKPAFTTFCAALLALGTSTATAQSADTPGLQSFELLQGWRTAGGDHMAAVRIRLDAGWKTYWRAPGGLGIPAQFDWSGSQNIASVRFHWPTPHVYDEDGLVTIGYKNELVLPIQFTPTRAGQDIVVSADVEFGVCADVCLPTAARIDAVLPQSGQSHGTAIRAALANRPQRGGDAGVRDVACVIKPSPDGYSLTAQMQTATTLSSRTLAVLEYPGTDIWIDETEARPQGRSMHISSTLYTMNDAPIILDRSRLRLTLFDGKTAIDIQGCPAG